MKTEPLITNAGLGDINLSTLNPRYLALESVRTDNAHVKEFLRNFQSEFWQAHRIKIHHSVKVTKERLVRDRILRFATHPKSPRPKFYFKSNLGGLVPPAAIQLIS